MRQIQTDLRSVKEKTTRKFQLFDQTKLSLATLFRSENMVDSEGSSQDWFNSPQFLRLSKSTDSPASTQKLASLVADRENCSPETVPRTPVKSLLSSFENRSDEIAIVKVVEKRRALAASNRNCPRKETPQQRSFSDSCAYVATSAKRNGRDVAQRFLNG